MMGTQGRLLGRVITDVDGGQVYGVARVRYDEGHVNAGCYEVERIDGTSFLAPDESLQVAPNWKDTPEEGKFGGEEFFRPSFLDGTRRRFLQATPGVLVPGDMEALRELIARIEPGWRVHWFNHCPNTFRGWVTVKSADSEGLRLEGEREFAWNFAWPTDGIEMGAQYGYEFTVEGDAFHRVDVSPQRYGKMPEVGLSLRFEPPKRSLY